MIYWGVLLERGMYDEAVDSLLGVASRCGSQNWTRISVPHTATEWAREQFTEAFMESTSDPYDTLVMLDADHKYPANVVERLALDPHPDYGVVAALAFCRGEDSRPAFYMKDSEDPEFWYSTSKIPENKIIPADMVGTGAIAIRRWVFDKLQPPYWKKMYDVVRGGEDWYFSLQCEKAGIARYVHTGVEIPHIRLGTVTRKDWEKYCYDNLSISDT